MKAHPLNLAVFRIVLFGVLLYFIPRNLIAVSGLPAELRVAPPGYGAFFEWIPINPALSQGMLGVCVLCCICGLIGFRTRTASFGALITGLYVYGVPQFFGKINHYHHFLLFLAVLAVSRSGDYLSVDWLVFLKKKKPMLSELYGLPLQMIWLLFGIIYFFPGYWKLRVSGLAWAFSDNLKYAMYHKWHELGGFHPPLPLDAHPLLFKTAALAVILFECLFIFLVFNRRTRIPLALGGLFFHWATGAFMGIAFWELRWFYVVFFDWAKLLRLQPVQAERASAQSLLPVRVMGYGLSFVMIVCGFTYFDSWPFAVYPTFAYLAQPKVTAVEVSIDENGESITVDAAKFSKLFGGEARWTNIQHRIINAEGAARQTLCENVAKSMHESFKDLAEATQITFMQTERWVDPQLQDEPPLKEETLCEIR